MYENLTTTYNVQLHREDPMLHQGNGTLKKKIIFFLEVELKKQVENNNYFHKIM